MLITLTAQPIFKNLPQFFCWQLTGSWQFRLGTIFCGEGLKKRGIVVVVVAAVSAVVEIVVSA